MVFNVYQRSWRFQLSEPGCGYFVALTAGVIVPAAVQALKVTPAQSKLELPYISRNLQATRKALGLSTIHERAFAGVSNLTGGWSRGLQRHWTTFRFGSPRSRLRLTRSFQQNGTGFTIAGLSLDRYRIGGALTPVRDRRAAGQCPQTCRPRHGQYPLAVHPTVRCGCFRRRNQQRVGTRSLTLRACARRDAMALRRSPSRRSTSG